MLKGLGRIVSLCVLIAIGSVGLYVYRDHFSAKHTIDKLTEEKKVLETVVQRLSSERRVAEIIVTDQKTVDGVLQTTLMFVEYPRDGRKPIPKEFKVKGRMAHVDAMVVKFDRELVKQDDPLRNSSIALFYRIYGDQESPESGPRIDKPDQIPDIYQGADPRVSDYELGLWKNFWRLVDDEAYRKERGVRIAHGEGVWGPFDKDRLYTITIEASGGLNLVSQPQPVIYQQALQRATTRPAN